MPPLTQLILEVAAIVTASAATYTAHQARKVAETVEKHDRVLFGEDAVEGWNGIVSLVREHEETLEEDGV